ncbi:hypothetical protein MKX01_030907 [Papaver californicum]|nr:hypothetical protein MKX01_030907 [Papaver californicum]
MSGRRGASTATNNRGRRNREAPDVVEMMRLMTGNQNGKRNAPLPPPGGNTNGPNPQVVDKWKEDIYKKIVVMRYTLVQRKQLIVFQLWGEARKWWKNTAIGLDENTLTYAQFYERFDAMYFPAT